MIELTNEVSELLLPPVRIPPFCPDKFDVDVLELIRTPSEATSCDVALVGAPFDTACISRRGSKWGPSAVRQGLIMWSHYNLDTGADLSDDFAIVDFGDIDVMHTNVPETHRRVEEVLTGLYDHGGVPILIGGDHSLAFPGIKALCNVVEGKIGVIGFDSHLDVRPSRHGEASSGMPITARDVHRRGTDAVIEETLDFVTEGVDALYFTLDVDALDIGSLPGTCIPSPGGLLTWEALELVDAFSSLPLMRGMDHVEVSPPLDTNNGISVTTGSALLMQMLGGVKKRKEAIAVGAVEAGLQV
jgi:arginase family enzyme